MRAEQILNLLESCVFDGELSIDNFKKKILDYLPENFEYNYSFGISKCVIIPNDCSYVIKIPFTGFKNYNEDYFTYFEGAETKDQWDYCLEEVLKYRKAKELKIHYILCKTKLIGTINTHPIYIQEKALTLESYCNIKNIDYNNALAYFKKDEKIAKEINKIRLKNHFLQIRILWLIEVYKYYGRSGFFKIMNYLKNSTIDDLHGGNLGFIGKKPVIFDYASYNQ